MFFRLLLAAIVSVPYILLVGCADTPEPGIESTETEAENPQETVSADTNQPPREQPEIPSSLDIGDAAPAIRIANWVKGAPVESFAAGKIYVVEFWATWCGPCRVGMPHLSNLQETYPDDVTFISVSDESLDTIKSFMQKSVDKRIDETAETWDDVMRYTVAVDDDGITNASYMLAAGQSGIPAAFVVGREGKVEWIGHPMDLDEPLEQIIAGTWDVEAVIAERKAEKERLARLTSLQTKLTAAMQKEDWDEALLLLGELAKDVPNPMPIRRLELLILTESGRTDQAVQLFEKLADEFDDQANVLNLLAWEIAENEASQEALLQAAIVAAERACQLTGYANGEVLDTLARVHYKLKNFDQAVAWQNRAVEAAPDKDRLQETLENYRSEAADTEKEPAATAPSDS